MKILVTGAAGNLGAEICRQLKENDEYEVFGTDIVAGQHVYYRLDLTQKDRLKEIDIRPNVIIHCAANIYGIAGFTDNPALILSKDTQMTINLLEFAGAVPIDEFQNFVYISSSMVYETANPADSMNLKEEIVDTLPIPRTDYGLSKLLGERLVKAYNLQYGLPYSIWRPFNIITPLERPGGDRTALGYSHVFADFFENIVLKKMNPLPIIGDGNQIRCFTWYEEVADLIANHVETATEDAYNIGNSEPIKMRDLARLIQEEAVERGLLPDEELMFYSVDDDFPNDVLIRVPCPNKTLQNLSWAANVHIKESISYCMDEWQNFLKE